MVDENVIYWLTRLDYICEALRIVAVVGLIVGVVAIVLGILITDGDDERRIGRFLLRFCWVPLLVAAVFGVGRILTPTTNEYVAIKVIPVIINNEDAQAIGQNAVILTKEWLREHVPKEQANQRELNPELEAFVRRNPKYEATAYALEGLLRLRPASGSPGLEER